MLQTNVVTSALVRTERRENRLARAVQQLLDDLAQLPPYEQAPELYTDWGEQGEFKVQVGRGECAL
ncbi:MAG: hypothetical protein RML36_10215 [Anaerolineae bacterium]|nr:hypothetical protein [Anaerolineae bacterium]MDW8099841.1 hypothetical protein [Anaerolineae bacterium]